MAESKESRISNVGGQGVATSGLHDSGLSSSTHGWSRNSYVAGTFDGKLPGPWIHKWGWWLIPAALAGLFGATVWGVNHVQAQVLQAAPQILRDAGIDPAGLNFRASYRNISVEGLLPPGVSADQVKKELERRAGSNGESIRYASVVVIEKAEQIVVPVPAPRVKAASLSAATKLAGINVSVIRKKGQLQLEGETPMQRHADTLLAAAGKSVGSHNVVNRLSVLDREPGSADADKLIERLADMLTVMDTDTTTANLTLDNTTLSGAIKTADRQALEKLKKAVTGDEVAVVFAVPADGPAGKDGSNRLAGEIKSLQDELNVIKDEVRDNVVFNTGSSRLLEKSYTTLDSVAAVMQKYPQPGIEIGGHTDWQASAKYNEKLSFQRANAVVSYLHSQGVSPSRLRAVGYGETRPIATNNTVAGRRMNRRVEFLSLAPF